MHYYLAAMMDVAVFRQNPSINNWHVSNNFSDLTTRETADFIEINVKFFQLQSRSTYISRINMLYKFKSVEIII